MQPFFPYGQPFNPYLQQPAQQPAPVQVVRVNGANGAQAFAIGPNSSALLLDESGTLVWLVTTDGAGYKTVSPYDISPHKAAHAPDLGSLEERITKLEEIIHGNAGDPAAAAGSKRNAGKPAAD